MRRGVVMEPLLLRVVSACLGVGGAMTNKQDND